MGFDYSKKSERRSVVVLRFALGCLPAQGCPCRGLLHDLPAADYFSILRNSISKISVENGLMLPRSCAL